MKNIIKAKPINQSHHNPNLEPFLLTMRQESPGKSWNGFWYDRCLV